MTPILLAFAAAQAAAAAPPAAPAAPLSPDAARFQTCAAQVRSAPERAVETANAWLVEGGGIFARQCLGLAYVALGRWAPAATVYEQAAREADAARDPRRADLWVQAGNSRLAAEEAAAAVQAFDAALATILLTPEMRGEVHLDRARALIAMRNSRGAREDVDRALELVPGDPFAWYVSAALAQRESNMERAVADIARARELAPDDPDVLLLAGTLAGLAGNGAEAERLYRQVATNAPQSDAGRRAQAALATMTDVPAPTAAAPQQPPAQPSQPPQSR